MRADTSPLPTSDLDRSPSFTLGTALVLLGHDCRGRCPDAAVSHRARVWFQHLAPGPHRTWTTTLVDVEFLGGPPSDPRRHGLLGEVNDCVRVDHIRVRERSAEERRGFLVALGARQGRARDAALPRAR